jgi:UDP-N-acetylglucosamine 2-epimerase (non-hydrolysing)
LVPLGTRPEIIKLAPVIRELRQRGFPIRVIATGQHYDRALATAIYEELGVEPDAVWQLAGDEAERFGTLLTHAMRELAGHRPDAVVVLGDTYTVPAFCLAARRHRVAVVHVEAGLRSHNPTSMEEANRRVAATTAHLHLAPTALAAENLRREGVPDERIVVVGNPITDVLLGLAALPRPISERRGVVMTAHRAGNVDDPMRRAQLVELIGRLARELPPVTFPMHPRTSAAFEGDGSLARLGAEPGITLTPPAPYTEMLRLLAGAQVVVTDSGGLQEECSWLGVPVVVLRPTTPRWEGVNDGTAVITGLDVERAVDAATWLARPEEQQRVAGVPCPYGDGHVAERIADLLAEPSTAELLAVREPDVATGGGIGALYDYV